MMKLSGLVRDRLRSIRKIALALANDAEILIKQDKVYKEIVKIAEEDGGEDERSVVEFILSEMRGRVEQGILPRIDEVDEFFEKGI